MPEIQAFRGIRYNLGQVGALSDVIAPPYDVIDERLQDELYKKHPCNVVRLILNRQEPADDEADNRYTRAKKFLDTWLKQGVLVPEADPAIYVYHQEFEVEGRRFVRKGFMARSKLEPFGTGTVFPHEETLAGPKMDRLMLMTVCKANLSQIFGLYPDPQTEVQAELDAAVADKTPLVAVDHLGVEHRLWPVTDVDVIAKVSAAMSGRPVFIADGHHRYETALEYMRHVAEMGLLHPEHPARYVLMMCVAMEDPGLAVLPTHRLFTGVPELDAAELAAKLGDAFETESVAQGPQAAHQLWERIEREGNQGTLALYTRKDDTWTLARLNPTGQERMEQVATDHTEAWRSLGVAVLHRLVVETLLGVSDLPKPNYVHLVREVVEGLETGDYPMAALVLPASVDDIRNVSLSGERMPAKSTYFYPKLASGLVINPLE